jgi:hypothetical protein
VSYIVAYIDVKYFSAKKWKGILSRNQPKNGFSRLVAKATSKGLGFQNPEIDVRRRFHPRFK